MNVTKQYEYRKRCLEAKGRECSVCEAGGSVLVHHIDGDRSNNDLENLVPLCEKHHRHVHAGYDTVPDEWIRALGKTPHPPDQETTTIEVSDETWRTLNRCKEPGETFDEVLRDLITTTEGEA